MPNNNSTRTPARPPTGLPSTSRRRGRTPDPVNNGGNINTNNTIGNVARALNFNNIPMTPPPSARGNNNIVLSPSPRTKKKRLEQVKATNYLSKYKNMLNNKKNYNTINKNTKNFNIENPVFLLSDVYESKDGKVKVIYSKKFLESAWKNRTIFKSPITGVRTKKELIMKFNPRLHHNKVLAKPDQLKKYKDNKKILINTVREEMFIEHFLVPVIKDKLPYVMKFIKIIHANHVNFSYFFVDVLGFERDRLSRLRIANIEKFTKKEVDKCIKVYKKLQKLCINIKYPIYKCLYIVYLRSKLIREYGVNNKSLRKIYSDLMKKEDLKNTLRMLNLSIFKNELKNLI